jgi:hypothetical protein
MIISDQEGVAVGLESSTVMKYKDRKKINATLQY